MDQKKLNKYGQMAYLHWKEYRPKMFAELEKNGQLEGVLLELQERVKNSMSDLIEKGLQHHEAWELVRDQIYLPSEDDLPNLSETDYQDLDVTGMKEQSQRQKILSQIEKSKNELGKAYLKALLNLPIPQKKGTKATERHALPAPDPVIGRDETE